MTSSILTALVLPYSAWRHARIGHFHCPEGGWVEQITSLDFLTGNHGFAFSAELSMRALGEDAIVSGHLVTEN